MDPIQRLPGVGNARMFGSSYAMRIWLDPDKLHAYGLGAEEVLAAVREQNVQVSAGNIGAEPAPGEPGNYRDRHRCDPFRQTGSVRRDHPQRPSRRQRGTAG